MSSHVLKFGGSNLKKKDDILRIVDVINKYDDDLVIVVSAFYGVTDMLVKALEEVKTDEKAIDKLAEDLLNLKIETLEEVIDDPAVRDEIFTRLLTRVNKLKRYLQGVNFFGDIPAFVNDTILSYGERLSSLMLAGILNYLNVNAEEILPEDIGLITDGEFSNATVDFDRAPKKVCAAVKGKSVVVVPGFYGVSDEGENDITR